MANGMVKQVYVPAEDQWVIKEIERLVEEDEKALIRQSFSAKALSVWRTGLAALKAGAELPR